MKFDVQIEGAERAQQALDTVRGRITAGVREAITRAAIDLTRWVKERKLSDQVLRVQTGRLRRSVTHRVETDGDRTEGFVGTNVGYGRVHEFGFKGKVNVRAHARNIKGQKIAVRAHPRNLDISARPFLRPSLQERWPVYERWIAKATKDAVDASRP